MKPNRRGVIVAQLLHGLMLRLAIQNLVSELRSTLAQQFVAGLQGRTALEMQNRFSASGDPT